VEEDLGGEFDLAGISGVLGLEYPESYRCSLEEREGMVSWAMLYSVEES
jgi:hypothetical protein